MNKTRLTNSMRTKTCQRIINATFRERALRLEQREHAVALRILRRELGEDALIRIAALPPGWLPMVCELSFDNHKVKLARRYARGESYYMTQASSLRLAQSMPVPSFVSHNKLEIGTESIAEIDALVVDLNVMSDEIEQLSRQILGTLGGFYTVESFAEGWSEGYAYFPHPELAPDTLPAHRVEDLNTRLAAAREAA